jgi:hypothetical protein
MLLTWDNVPVVIPNIKTQSSGLIRLYLRTFNKPLGYLNRQKKVDKTTLENH